MSDHAVTLTVVLNEDHRIDDLEEIINAIKMIKNVIDVKANVADIKDYQAYARARYDLILKIYDILN